jgi:hypothetical protein
VRFLAIFSINQDLYLQRVFEAFSCQTLDPQWLCNDPSFFGNMTSGNSMGCSVIDSFCMFSPYYAGVYSIPQSAVTDIIRQLSE